MGNYKKENLASTETSSWLELQASLVHKGNQAMKQKQADIWVYTANHLCLTHDDLARDVTAKLSLPVLSNRN